MELLEQKNNQNKDLDEFNNRIERIKERIHELEDKTIEVSNFEQ